MYRLPASASWCRQPAWFACAGTPATTGPTWPTVVTRLQLNTAVGKPPRFYLVGGACTPAALQIASNHPPAADAMHTICSVPYCASYMGVSYMTIRDPTPCCAGKCAVNRQRRVWLCPWQLPDCPAASGRSAMLHGVLWTGRSAGGGSAWCIKSLNAALLVPRPADPTPEATSASISLVRAFFSVQVSAMATARHCCLEEG